MIRAIPTIETERLILRPFRLEDADSVQSLAGERSIADTTLNIPHPYEDGMAEAWISKHQHSFELEIGVTFAITSKVEATFIGAISLMGMVKGHRAELGYWIGRLFWGQGICTEAGAAILRYAFEDLGLIRVYASHFARNPASGRVMRKLGMQQEGVLRRHIRKWGVLEDSIIYGILRDDWSEAANHLVTYTEGSCPVSSDTPASDPPSMFAPRG